MDPSLSTEHVTKGTRMSFAFLWRSMESVPQLRPRSISSLYCVCSCLIYSCYTICREVCRPFIWQRWEVNSLMTTMWTQRLRYLKYKVLMSAVKEPSTTHSLGLQYTCKHWQKSLCVQMVSKGHKTHMPALYLYAH